VSAPIAHLDHVDRAPPGFTAEQWRDFDRDGFLVLPDVFSDDAAEALLNAAYHVARADPKYDGEKYYGTEAVVERHVAFADLIAHPRHVGYAYDLYGEQLRLHTSQLFLRPPGGAVSEWHIDGARLVPYRAYSPRLPLTIKIGYWLTDVTEAAMGCLVVIPGSQRWDMIDAYTQHQAVPGEIRVTLRRGTVTVMHHALWHRVEPNSSDTVRANIYLAYGPSWVHASDRIVADRDWAAALPRTARIIMRAYGTPYEFAKPPPADVPLFLPRDDDARAVPGPDHVPSHLAPHPLPVERFLDEG
jgi:hypothetical protein